MAWNARSVKPRLRRLQPNHGPPSIARKLYGQPTPEVSRDPEMV